MFFAFAHSQGAFFHRNGPPISYRYPVCLGTLRTHRTPVTSGDHLAHWCPTEPLTLFLCRPSSASLVVFGRTLHMLLRPQTALPKFVFLTDRSRCSWTNRRSVSEGHWFAVSRPGFSPASFERHQCGDCTRRCISANPSCSRIRIPISLFPRMMRSRIPFSEALSEPLDKDPDLAWYW